MTRKAALAAIALAVLYAGSSVSTWLQAPAGTRPVRHASTSVTSILHISAAVVLVALATVMTLAAVRAVSRRPVVRVRYQGDDEPPLPCHKPEPEPEEDARPVLSPSRQASALPLPGREPAVLPEPERREVPR